MDFLKGKVVVSDGIIYADGVFFLSREMMASKDEAVQIALSDLYDIASEN